MLYMKSKVQDRIFSPKTMQRKRVENHVWSIQVQLYVTKNKNKKTPQTNKDPNPVNLEF